LLPNRDGSFSGYWLRHDQEPSSNMLIIIIHTS
jgi:hypothetical protein